MVFCSFLFVCMELIQIHISEQNWTKLYTCLPLRLQETAGYVWSENVSPFSTFLTFFAGSECRILGTTWLPAQDTSATALYLWFLRVLVWRHVLADGTCPESSTTALYLWFLQGVSVTSRKWCCSGRHLRVLTLSVVRYGYCIKNAVKWTECMCVKMETWWERKQLNKKFQLQLLQ